MRLETYGMEPSKRVAFEPVETGHDFINSLRAMDMVASRIRILRTKHDAGEVSRFVPTVVTEDMHTSLTCEPRAAWLSAITGSIPDDSEALVLRNNRICHSGVVELYGVPRTSSRRKEPLDSSSEAEKRTGKKKEKTESGFRIRDSKSRDSAFSIQTGPTEAPSIRGPGSF